MADALALGASVLDVGVQVPSSAPIKYFAEVAQLVERHLAKVNVASSNLVFRSTKTHQKCVLTYGRLAQLVEQLTLNQWVRSSSLRSSTKKSPKRGCLFLTRGGEKSHRLAEPSKMANATERSEVSSTKKTPKRGCLFFDERRREEPPLSRAIRDGERHGAKRSIVHQSTNCIFLRAVYLR